MLGRSHAILGIATTAVVLSWNGTNIIEDTSVFIAALSVGTVAALLPDIDTPNTLLRKSFRVGGQQTSRELRSWRQLSLLQLVYAFFRWILARFLNIIDKILPHRGPTHYGITAAALTALVYWICQVQGWPWEIWVAFGVGYFSHLLGDGVTKTGVRLFAPIFPRFVRFLPKPICIVTGTDTEPFMLAGLIIVMLLPLFWFGIG